MAIVEKRIEVGTASSQEAGKSQGSWAILDRVAGGAYEVPVLIVRGNSPGPVLWVNAGIHGDEYEGPVAAAQLFAELPPAELSGSIVVTPVINLPAFEAKTRTSPLDLQDLNRSFPGNPNGLPSQRIAHLILSTMVEHADYVVDLHGGGLDKLILPYASYYELAEAGRVAKELAEATGVDMLLGTPGDVIAGGTLAGALVKQGVPAITLESGAEGRLRDEYVDVHYAALTNVLRHLQMIPGSPAPPKRLIRAINGQNLFIDRGGLIRYSVRPKDVVTMGDVIGEIFNLSGSLVETLRAPHDGVISLIKTSPAVSGGDRVATIADLVQIDGDNDSTSERSGRNRD